MSISRDTDQIEFETAWSLLVDLEAVLADVEQPIWTLPLSPSKECKPRY